MATLDLENKLLTVIVLFKVKPGKQAEALEIVRQLFAIAQKQSGLVSANLHRSLDGEKIANYAQWEDEDSLNKFRQLPETLALIGPIQGLVEEMDGLPYEIVASESKVGVPKINPGEYFVHFAEFRMTKENQPRMVELAKEHIGPAMSDENLLSATFHRSMDGTRVINYGQWKNEDAISQFIKRPGFGKEDGYWTGLAENVFHLYEVLLTVP